jgi:hypothetical protein
LPLAKGKGTRVFQRIQGGPGMRTMTAPETLVHVIPSSPNEIDAFEKEQLAALRLSSTGQSMETYGAHVEALEDLCIEMRERVRVHGAEPGTSRHASQWAAICLFYFIRWQHALVNEQPLQALDPGGRGWELFLVALQRRCPLYMEQCLAWSGYMCELCGLPGMTDKMCAVCSRGLDVLTAPADLPARLITPAGFDKAQRDLRAEPGNQSLAPTQFLEKFKRAHPGPWSVHAEAARARAVLVASITAAAGVKVESASRATVWDHLENHQAAIIPPELKGRFAGMRAGGSLF